MSICHELDRLDKVIVEMQLHREYPEHNIPDLCKAYNMLLRQLHLMFDRQADAPATAQRHNFMQFEAASTQFVEEVRRAIKYSKMSDETRVQDAGREML